MRRNVVYLVSAFGVVLGALALTIVSGNSPVLGLDLQGGVAVRLVPVGDPPEDSLETARDIIANRVDSLGVAEAEVQREGGDIVVNLPGVKDRDKAQRIVGRTAELQFRAVEQELPPEPEEPTTTTAAPGQTAPPETAPADTTTTTAPTTTTTAPPTTAPPAEGEQPAEECPPITADATGNVPTTPAEEIRSDCAIVVPGREVEDVARYQLGPTLLTGESIGEADAQFQSPEWLVTVDFKGDDFVTQVAEPYVNQQVAIVLDGIVQSAPLINPGITGESVQISGGFGQGEAEDLARLLRFGALPVRFDEGQQTVENVSPTLGRDQLRAGIAAGLVGIALVAVYMLIYYRLLGLVVIVGLALTGAATYSLISYLGDSIGLALTLAGVTGLIVSVGVTVDSYVVYFERLKDEVRTGKTVRSSVDRGFARSFQTILAADLVSLIGAAVLYFLAIGSVRGFAFFLGLATLLDLVISYFFMHPMVVLLARRPGLLRARYVGIASGLDAEGARA